MRETLFVLGAWAQAFGFPCFGLGIGFWTVLFLEKSGRSWCLYCSFCMASAVLGVLSSLVKLFRT